MNYKLKPSISIVGNVFGLLRPNPIRPGGILIRNVKRFWHDYQIIHILFDPYNQIPCLKTTRTQHKLLSVGHLFVNLELQLGQQEFILAELGQQDLNMIF